MASCYSCRKKFKLSELRVSYSKNYCEECGFGLFGGGYYSFSEKPVLTVQRTIAVYLKVILFWGTGLWLLVLLFWFA
jgi:ribosomal protein L37AE/L43A